MSAECFTRSRKRCGIIIIKTAGAGIAQTGHHIGWSAKDSESAADKLRKENAQLQSRLADAREAKNSADKRTSAIKGQMTKLKNRIENGVCIHCNRTFQNLARHMKCKHPGEPAEGRS